MDDYCIYLFSRFDISRIVLTINELLTLNLAYLLFLIMSNNRIDSCLVIWIFTESLYFIMLASVVLRFLIKSTETSPERKKLNFAYYHHHISPNDPSCCTEYWAVDDVFPRSSIYQLSPTSQRQSRNLSSIYGISRMRIFGMYRIVALTAVRATI